MLELEMKSFQYFSKYINVTLTVIRQSVNCQESLFFSLSSSPYGTESLFRLISLFSFAENHFKAKLKLCQNVNSIFRGWEWEHFVAA